MTPTDKKDVVEQRVKPTVIRRRAKEMPPEPPQPKSVEMLPKEKNLQPKLEAKPEILQPIPFQVLEPRVVEKEEKPKKGPKRKKTKAELDLEEIQRAGGLKQYAQVFSEEEPTTPEWEPTVERIFEPTLQAGRRKKAIRREFKKTPIAETKASKKVIRIEKEISVSELSQEMGVKVSDIVKKLMGLGVMATANQMLDTDTATLIATDYGYEVVQTAFKEEEVLKTPTKAEETRELKIRAPVVTVMGHVDHGKTSLLDAIRKTKVVEKEAGGITQHIGAYEVHLPKGNITFLDTPGHEAFTRMRARGAKATDIVVLVVAADDGVMPQTIEAIDHAMAAGVPIIVAINKIDKPGADAEKVKRNLTEHGLVPEEWGGDVVCASTSAKTKQGLDHLLEMILLVAQVQDLKAPFSGPGKGVVIESRLDKGRGPAVTVLVQTGLVKTGDYVVAGLSYGRVRAMTASDGSPVEEAFPSQAVELLGLQTVPEAGDELFVVEDERDARQIAETRQAKRRKEELATTATFSLEALQEKISKGEAQELPLVLKADVIGSVEALAESLKKLGTEKVSVKILHHGTGGISENDVMLAKASKAVIVGFNVAPEGKARALAEQEGIEIRLHSIIYEVLDDIKKAMEGLLKPEAREKFLGRAQVKQVFKISKVGTVAGLLIADGVVRRTAQVRLVRDGAIIYQGKISSLKRFKEDVREVTTNMECGLSIENFNDIKEGDVIEAFIVEQIAQTL